MTQQDRSPWRRWAAVVTFEGTLLAVAALLGRVTPLLVVIVVGASVYETVRALRATRTPTAPAAPAAADGVIGADLAVDIPATVSIEQRLASAGAAGASVVDLEHPGELVPYVDVDPCDLDGFTWTVALHDEVRVFVDDDALFDVEGSDPLETRMAALPGVRDVMREDREIIHVAAPSLTAEQVHEAAVAVLADAAAATAALEH